MCCCFSCSDDDDNKACKGVTVQLGSTGGLPQVAVDAAKSVCAQDGTDCGNAVIECVADALGTDVATVASLGISIGKLAQHCLVG